MADATASHDGAAVVSSDADADVPASLADEHARTPTERVRARVASDDERKAMVRDMTDSWMFVI
jgi:hypothetical protein